LEQAWKRKAEGAPGGRGRVGRKGIEVRGGKQGGGERGGGNRVGGAKPASRKKIKKWKKNGKGMFYLRTIWTEGPENGVAVPDAAGNKKDKTN